MGIWGFRCGVAEELFVALITVAPRLIRLGVVSGMSWCCCFYPTSECVACEEVGGLVNKSEKKTREEVMAGSELLAEEGICYEGD